MGKIHAPFNFVPTPDGITIPEGVLNTVQDVPYEDGFSGKIHVKIEAKTPVFVRNGHSKEEQEDFQKDFKAKDSAKLKDINEVQKLVNAHSEYCSFSHTPDGLFFIPATTFKGAVREVLSILSRGKMRVDPLSKPAIQREIGARNNATGLYTLLDDQSNIQAGWIRAEGDHYVIVPAEKYYRVSLEELDKYFGFTKFREEFEIVKTSNESEKSSTKKKYIRNDSNITAYYKYRIIENANKTEEDLHVDWNQLLNTRPHKRVVGLRRGTKGYIVMTGQSSGAEDWGKRKKATENKPGSKGKYYDFVFVGRKESYLYKLSDEEFSQYDSVYGDSVDWKQLKIKVNKGKEYPVFFRPDKAQKIKDFGLTMLYKLPYKYTPLQIEQIRAESYRTRHDMAERIFGFVGDDSEKLSVRGRVQFQHLICSKNNGYYSPQIVTLNSPKSTYYPIYIRQNHFPDGRIKNSYQTYNDGKLSGWKRYVNRNTIINTSHAINTKLDTIIYPLKAGSIFEGNIAFHNLREYELGALLSALTFHDTEGCYYQIGQGKPYGFGKVKVSAELIEALPNAEGFQTDLKKALMAFEFEVNVGGSGSSWLESNTIKELFALSSRGIEDAKPGSDFSYMKLDVKNKNGNDFVNARNERQTLLAFSELLAAAALKPDSCLTSDDFERIRDEKARRAQEDARRKQEEAEEGHRKQEEEEARRKQEEAEEAHRKQVEAEEARRMQVEEEARRRQEEEEERRRQEEEEERRLNDEKKEKYDRPLNDVIAKQLSFNALANNVSKWIGFISCSLSPEDSAIVESKITEIYSKMKSKEKKSWTKLDKWISTFPFLDPSVVNKLFETLVGK